MIPSYYSILVPSTLEQYHAFARCPNGTHKSPSGVCEQVVPHEGLPRCPNGFHRSPSGICEAVNGNGNSATPNNNNIAGSSNNNEIKNGNSTTTSSRDSSSLAGQCDQTLESRIQSK